MNGTKVVLSFIFILLGVGSLFSQDAVGSAGGEASGLGGTVSYTIGQVAYTTAVGTNGSISQGVQQAFEIFTSLENSKGIEIQLSAYPNPTTGLLRIKVENHTGLFNYQVFDLQGKLLYAKPIINQSGTIDMQGLSQGTYYLRVFESNSFIKTLKIIKL